MRNFQKVKQCSLFNLVHSVFIRVVVWKGPLSHGIKDVGVEGCWIIDDVRLTNEFQLPVLIARQIRSNTQGDHILATSQPTSKGYPFAMQRCLWFQGVTQKTFLEACTVQSKNLNRMT